MHPRISLLGALWFASMVIAGPLAAQTGWFPAAGAAGIPWDVQPKIRFDGPAVLTGRGKITIREAGASSVVETIDNAGPVATQAIGGLGGFHYYPVTLDGQEAAIHPRNGELRPGKTYEIQADAGVFRIGDQDSPAIAAGAWRFATRGNFTPEGRSALTIAADGTGDFCSVQGALDFIPAGNTRPIKLRLKPGLYTELVFFTNKHGITLAGDDREACIIAYANNERFNLGGGNPYAPGNNPSASFLLDGHKVYHRGVFLAHRSRDFTLTNLTIHNTTPHGGSQSEALILNGEADARARIENVHFVSFQDTVQFNGQTYVHHCLVEGDVDFMWGTGPCYWSDCTCRAVNSNAYYTQIRNPAGQHGFVYRHCVLDGSPGVQGVYLSRIEPQRFPGSEVVLIDCALGPAVIPVGWQLQRSSDPAQIQFLEYDSHGLKGEPLDFSQRLTGSRRLIQPNDAALIANYERPAYVLGNGWNP